MTKLVLGFSDVRNLFQYPERNLINSNALLVKPLFYVMRMLSFSGYQPIFRDYSVFSLVLDTYRHKKNLTDAPV